MTAGGGPDQAPADDKLTAGLMETLSDLGPSSTGTLAAKLKVDAHTVRFAMKRLEAKNLVHSTGATYSQRWHLGAKSASRPTPAKEAESRRR